MTTHDEHYAERRAREHRRAACTDTYATYLAHSIAAMAWEARRDRIAEGGAAPLPTHRLLGATALAAWDRTWLVDRPATPPGGWAWRPFAGRRGAAHAAWGQRRP